MPPNHSVVDKNDFNKQLKDAGTNLVVVEFYLPGNEGHENINLPLRNLAQKYQEVHFLQVDAHSCVELGQYYRIVSSPTFLFFKDGAKIAEFFGNINDLEQIKEFIKEINGNY